MRSAAVILLLASGLAATPLSAALAQTIIDLSKPQTGKSRFVLNPDLTPADLGEKDDAKPVAAASRAAACGEGCKMLQPAVQRQTDGYAPAAAQSGARTVIVANARNVQNATENKAAPRSSFRLRRR